MEEGIKFFGRVVGFLEVAGYLCCYWDLQNCDEKFIESDFIESENWEVWFPL